MDITSGERRQVIGACYGGHYSFYHHCYYKPQGRRGGGYVSRRGYRDDWGGPVIFPGGWSGGGSSGGGGWSGGGGGFGGFGGGGFGGGGAGGSW